MTGGTIQTGGALGDLYGYSLTFTGQEQFPAQFLSGSTTANALGGLTANYTVVYGASA
jgi:glutamate/tyrosine decarboxylase-like PLP-dependent enzyme